MKISVVWVTLVFLFPVLRSHADASTPDRYRHVKVEISLEESLARRPEMRRLAFSVTEAASALLRDFLEIQLDFDPGLVVRFDQTRFKPDPLIDNDSSPIDVLQQLVPPWFGEVVVGFFPPEGNADLKGMKGSLGFSRRFGRHVSVVLLAESDVRRSRGSLKDRTHDVLARTLAHEIVHLFGGVHVRNRHDLMGPDRSDAALDLRPKVLSKNARMIPFSWVNLVLVSIGKRLNLADGCRILTRSFIDAYYANIENHLDAVVLQPPITTIEEDRASVAKGLARRTILLAKNLAYPYQANEALTCWERGRLFSPNLDVPRETKDSLEAYISKNEGDRYALRRRLAELDSAVLQ